MLDKGQLTALGKGLHGQEWAWDLVKASKVIGSISTEQMMNLAVRLMVTGEAIMEEIGTYFVNMSAYEKGQIVGELSYEAFKWSGYAA